MRGPNLAARGIQDRAVVERMRIGYAPGACLRGHLERLGYRRQALLVLRLGSGNPATELHTLLRHKIQTDPLPGGDAHFSQRVAGVWSQILRGGGDFAAAGGAGG
jgi:hypothetical protein